MDSHNLGKEHVVRAEWNNLLYDALQIHWGFVYHRGFDNAATDGREVGLEELVVLFP